MHRFQKWLAVILAAVCLCAAGTGCSKEEALVWTEEYARIMKLCGSGWLTEGNLAVTAADGCTYRFEKGIPEEDKTACIREQQTLLGLLDAGGISADGLQLYVLENIVSHADGEKTIYMDVSAAGTAEQILLTLRGLYGEYADYGWLLGMTGTIAEALGWQTESPPEPDPDVFRASPILLNLSYPCFTEPYVTPEQQDACRALAFYLCRTADIQSETDFRNAVQAYAADIGVDFTPTYLRFSYAAEDCPLKIRTAYLQMYLDSEYRGSCTLSEQSMAEDPMFRLTEMIAFLEKLDVRIGELREAFGHTDAGLFPVYLRPIAGKFAATGGEWAGMYYPRGEKSYIEAADIYSLTHEYVHYLDDCTGTGDDSWCGEVLAVYYEQDMTYLERCVSARYGAPITIEWLSECIGQPYDSVEDEILFQHIMTAHEENPRYSLITLYNGRLSFGDYFVTMYGEEAFRNCMLLPAKTKIHTGMTMDEIVDQWCVWLERYKR